MRAGKKMGGRKPHNTEAGDDFLNTTLKAWASKGKLNETS